MWDRLGFTHLPGFFGTDFREWLKTFALHLRGTVFVVICWSIWCARNEAIFANNNWSVWTILNKIRSHHDTITTVYGHSSLSRPTRMVQWRPPDDGAVKLNVDGSSFGNPGRSGYGGVLRNWLGEWLLGFSRSCGFTTNLTAELFAIACGLKVAWFAGYKKIVCESDSQLALSLIKEGVSRFHPHAAILDTIRLVISRD